MITAKKIITAPAKLMEAPFGKIAKMYIVERNIARIGSPNFKGTDADRLKLINSTLELCRKGSRNYFSLVFERRRMVLNEGYDKHSSGARIGYLQKLMADSNELALLRPNNEIMQDTAKSAKNAYDEAVRDATLRALHEKP